MQLIVRHEVADHDAWRAAFDGDAEGRRQAGLSLLQIWRDADDATRVWLLFEAADRARGQGVDERRRGVDPGGDVPVDDVGRVDPSDVEDAIRDDTVLVSVMANRELGTDKTLGPRDGVDLASELSPVGGRLVRAMNNHFEALILFTLAVVVVTMSGQSGGLTAICAWIYLAARVLYVPAYALGLVPWRSVIWTIGFAATLAMIERPTRRIVLQELVRREVDLRSEGDGGGSEEYRHADGGPKMVRTRRAITPSRMSSAERRSSAWTKMSS